MDGRKLKYSVIIPVYNSEKTIQKCLDSLLYQIPEDAELLVINDGSTDKSGEICSRYEAEYPSVHYYVKENGGVSTARNVGLDNAGGEYILFADSDDFVQPQYWRVIDTFIDRYQPDMLQWGFRDCGETVRERGTGDYAVSEEQSVSEKVEIALRSYLFCSLPFRSFKREIISRFQLKFETELDIGEDQVFIFSYALHIDTLVSTSEVLYNVMLNTTESLSRKRRDYLLDQLMRVNELMYQSLEDSDVSAVVRARYKSALAWIYYRSAYSVCKELLKYNLSRRERKIKIKEICSLYKRKKIKKCDFKCKVIAFPIIHGMAGLIDMLCKNR